MLIIEKVAAYIESFKKNNQPLPYSIIKLDLDLKVKNMSIKDFNGPIPDKFAAPILEEHIKKAQRKVDTTIDSSMRNTYAAELNILKSFRNQ